MPEMQKAGLWIDGCEVPAKSGEPLEVYDPGRDEIFATAARGVAADVDHAVEAAERAFRSKAWRGLNPFERGRMLWAWARKVEAHKPELAELLSLENGKPLHESLDEIDTVIRLFEYYGGWADKADGRVLLVPDGAFDYLLHEPLGVVGHIIPWNYPVDIFARGIAPCLAVGNTCVAKPAEETPLTTLAITRLSVEAGLPPGVVNVVTGLGAEAGAALAAHTGIQGLAFCGSVDTGKEVLAAAARNITPVVSLELGGKSPSIVFADANIEQAARHAARGICHNGGQSCGARSRLLVPKNLFHIFAKQVVEEMGKVSVGYWQDDPDMGPLVSRAQLERVMSYIESGRRDGARVLSGGGRPQGDTLSRGYYLEPTLFVDAAPGMTIVEEEIFGPVTCIMTYDTEEEAIELANRSRYGLSAEVWTRDLGRAHRAAAALDASHVTVNGSGGFGIEAPFGGLKQSGFGREGGLESILQYTRVKNVWVEVAGA